MMMGLVALFPDARRRVRAFGHCLAAPLILLILAPIVIPFTAEGFPWGHDTPPHLANLFRFDRALWQGQFPVRWVEGLRPGSGQPLFNFYQVGFYYLVEAIHATGVPLSTAFKAVPVLLWWIGALFTWRWLRPFGRDAAFAASLTFALSPYVIIDVFVRAAYPEFTAIVGTVGTLWAADGFMRTRAPAYLLALSTLTALVLISHLPACLIAAPLLVSQVLVRALTDRQSRERLPPLLVAAGLGAGLSMFYVGPALLELGLVNMHRLTTGGVDFRNNFVPGSMWAPRVRFEWNYFGTAVTGTDSLMPLQISIVQWAVIVGSSASLVLGPWRRGLFNRACVVLWLLTIAFALFMMHAESLPIWERVPGLAVLQFPWRFFLLISVAGAGLTAALISSVPFSIVRAACVVSIVGAQVYLYYPHLPPGMFLERATMNIDDPGWRRAGAERPARMFEEPGYDPVGTEPDPTVTSAWSLLGPARAPPVSQTDVEIALQVDAPQPVDLRFNIPSFPGWHVAIDREGAAVTLAPNGYMLVKVPGGSHVVRAYFANPRVRLVANAVSLLSATVILVSWGLRSRRGALSRR